MDPALLQELLAFLQSNGQFTTKGAPKPMSLDEQAKKTNWQQDQYTSLSNPLMAASLGGQGAFDPKVFQDVQDGVDSYNVPSDPMAAYHSLPDGSEEKTIAKYLTEDGLSPEQIVAKFSNAGYKNATGDKALDRVRATANTMFKARATYQDQISSVPGFDPSTGQWSVPQGGQHIAGKLTMPKYKRSDAAMIFDKAGLPTPDQQFSPASFGFDGTQQQVQGGLAAQIAQLAGQHYNTHKSFMDQAAGDQQQAAQYDQMQQMLQRASASGPPAGHDALTPGDTVDAPAGATHGLAIAKGMAPVPQSPLEALMASPEWKNGFGKLSKQQVDSMKAASQRSHAPAAGAAYDQQKKTAADLFLATNEARKYKVQSDGEKAYADRMNALHQQNGLTPLTMAMMQRVRGLAGA